MLKGRLNESVRRTFVLRVARAAVGDYIVELNFYLPTSPGPTGTLNQEGAQLCIRFGTDSATFRGVFVFLWWAHMVFLHVSSSMCEVVLHP